VLITHISRLVKRTKLSKGNLKMELAIEVMIYIGVGVLLSGLIILLLIGWNIEKDTETISNLYGPEESLEFESIDLETFAIKTQTYWQNCDEYKINDTVSFYVYNNETVRTFALTRTSLFDIYRKLNWCTSIQSVSNSCGLREDVSFGSTIDLPAVIRLTCLNDSLKIE